MILIFIGLLVVILSFNFFQLAYQVNGINRLVINTPLTIIEVHTDLFNDMILSFNREEVKKDFDKYYSQIAQYTDKYKVNYAFYDYVNQICVKNTCYSVKVIIDAELLLNFKYHREMSYRITATNE